MLRYVTRCPKETEKRVFKSLLHQPYPLQVVVNVRRPGADYIVFIVFFPRVERELYRGKHNSWLTEMKLTKGDFESHHTANVP